MSKEIGEPVTMGCTNGSIAYLHHDIIQKEVFSVMETAMESSQYSAVGVRNNNCYMILICHHEALLDRGVRPLGLQCISKLHAICWCDGSEKWSKKNRWRFSIRYCSMFIRLKDLFDDFTHLRILSWPVQIDLQSQHILSTKLSIKFTPRRNGSEIV